MMMVCELLGNSLPSCSPKAFNEFHRLLGDGKHDDYNALKAFSDCLSGAIERTNKIMGG